MPRETRTRISRATSLGCLGARGYCGVQTTVAGSSWLPPPLAALFMTHVNDAGGGALWPVQRSKLIVGDHVACPAVAAKVTCTALLKSLSVAMPLTPVRRGVVPPVATFPVPGSATTPEG